MATPTPIPNPAIPKSGTYTQESNVFVAVTDSFRFMGQSRLRVSKNSPPIIGKDITEGQHVWDRKTNRLYTVSQGQLRYVAYT